MGCPSINVQANISHVIEVTRKFNKRNLHGSQSASAYKKLFT